MWTCPKCKNQVEDGFEVCWSCGTSAAEVQAPDFVPEQEGFISEDEYRAETEARKREDLVTVETFWTAAEAHAALGLLEAEGIHGVVTDEIATTITWPLLQDHGGIKLQVPAHEVERARQLLAEVRHEEGPEGKG